MIRRLPVITLFLFIISLSSCKIVMVTNLNTTANADSLCNISGKWFWYKTLINDTSGGKTKIDTFYNDNSTYNFTHNHVVYTSAFYRSDNSTANDSMKYSISGSKIGFVRFTSLSDTNWYDIKNCNINGINNINGA